MIIALMAVMVFSTSGFNEQRFGTRAGDMAPMLTLSNQSTTTTLSAERGKYVLLTFWSSNDAVSRQRAHEYDVWYRRAAHQSQELSLYGVNLDESRGLYNEIVRLDKLNATTQFFARDAKSDKIVRDFSLADGMKSLLIGRDGRIMKVNPTLNDLQTLLSL